MPPDALVYCSKSCEDDPKGSTSSAYESDMERGVNSTEAGDGESETTLVARAWLRRASDQRMGVRSGRTLGWPSVRRKMDKETNGLVIGWIRFLSYDHHHEQHKW